MPFLKLINTNFYCILCWDALLIFLLSVTLPSPKTTIQEALWHTLSALDRVLEFLLCTQIRLTKGEYTHRLFCYIHLFKFYLHKSLINHMLATHCFCRTGQNKLLNLKPSTGMWKKGDFSDFEGGMVVCISETADLLRIFHTPISRVYRKKV